MKKIIVVGGLSAGPSAAAKARREDEFAQITLFEKTADISYATCGIPYALSGQIPEREKLLVTDVKVLQNRFKVDVRLNEEVVDVDPTRKLVITPLGEYPYDKLIYTTGARTFIPRIENLQQTNNWSPCRSLGDFDRIRKDALQDNIKHVTIMGAGLIGVEVAENLIHAGKQVTLIEGGDHILPMWTSKFSAFAQNVLEDKGIEVIKNTFVKRVVEKEGKIVQIDLGNHQYLDTDFLIMSVGIKPNTEILLNKGAKALPNGALLVNKHFETSLPHIYAAGDNASINNILNAQHDYLPLGTHSNKGGRAAAINALGGEETLAGGYRTAIVQLFDHTLARTGLCSRELDRLGIAHQKTLIVANATPGYYPDPSDLIIETYYDAENLTLMGAEVFGKKGVDKRIDVLSTAIYAKLKITDLPQLDLAYAPPYSPAKDPVVINGYLASNAIKNDYVEMDAEELHQMLSHNEDFTIIDVRGPAERKVAGYISGSFNIPLDDLRNRLDEVPKDKTVVVHCAKGLRGYIAFTILKQHGFDNIQNLAGGYKVWEAYTRQHPVSWPLAYELV